MHMSKTEKRINKKVLLGVTLLLVGLTVLLLTLAPVINAYVKQKISSQPSTTNVVIAKSEDEITTEVKKDTQEVSIDSNFGIYIPRIKSNSKVVKDVNPYDEAEYTKALQTGVAHARGTVSPNQQGNVFLFAHSAVNFYEKNNYTVYFYLLGELEKGDEIFVSYNGIIYKYRVDEVKIVDKEDIKYLKNYSDQDTLTLMTCYPPGSNWKRTMVIAYRDLKTPLL